MGTCSADMDHCTNAATTLDFSEICKYGSNAHLNIVPTWVATCFAAVAVANCEKAYFDFATTTNFCAKCLNTHSRSLAAPYTCEAACTAGLSTSVSYKFLGQEYKGGKLCLRDLANCATFNDFYFFGCLTCKPKHYLFKTKNLFPYFTNIVPAQADKEVTVCAECYETCAECLDYSPYSCTKCDPPLFLYQSTCITECPTGYTPDATRVCQTNNCALHEYAYAAGPPNCVKKCPENYFANNSTISCT